MSEWVSERVNYLISYWNDLTNPSLISVRKVEKIDF